MKNIAAQLRADVENRRKASKPPARNIAQETSYLCSLVEGVYDKVIARCREATKINQTSTTYEWEMSPMPVGLPEEVASNALVFRLEGDGFKVKRTLAYQFCEAWGSPSDGQFEEEHNATVLTLEISW